MFKKILNILPTVLGTIVLVLVLLKKVSASSLAFWMVFYFAEGLRTSKNVASMCAAKGISWKTASLSYTIPCAIYSLLMLRLDGKSMLSTVLLLISFVLCVISVVRVRKHCSLNTNGGV